MNGTTTTKKKVPLDLEELIRKKKEADAAAAKPRFLTKAQREKLAAQKAADEKAQEEESERKRKEQLEESRRKFARGAQQGSYRSYGESSSSIPTGPKAMRQNGGANGHPTPADRGGKEASKKGMNGNGKRTMEDDEAQILKQRYLGPEVNKSTFSASKKRKRTTEKKFNFEWDADEDTSKDYDPVYSHQSSGIIGAGRLAGFGEEAEIEAAKRWARGIEERDRENGRQRAKEYLDQFYRGLEHRKKNSLGKHWSDKSLDEMRERDWRIFKEDFEISTKGGGVPNPMRNWDESGLPARLMDVVRSVGYNEPTPIQRAAIPIALQARDLIGVAQTGSGKTASFLLPLLVYISGLPMLDDHNKGDGPYALILAPTRELAQQIEAEAKKFATPLGFSCVSIVGGHSIEEQAFALRNGAEIVVATPGRLVDCIERRLLVLQQCCYIIMDEADKMVQLGFEDSLNKILDALPINNEKPDTEEAEDSKAMMRYLGNSNRYRQTMMYTATMPPPVEKIAKKYLRRPAIVTIGNAGEAVDSVEQRVEFISGEDKRKKRLGEILTSGQFASPVIVFVNIRRNCDTVARDIKRLGFSTVTFHGGKDQSQRESALKSLRDGETDVLVATDVAGRGIDVPDVSLVVNFNMATNIDSYTHRIGRTGRAGKTGVAITFLGGEDSDVMYDLKQIIQKSNISKLPDELKRHEAAQSKPNKGGKAIEH
ncbi:unnamed protein product [Discula destructiva]